MTQSSTKTRRGTHEQHRDNMAAYHCCVPSCVSDSRYDIGKKLTFHRIPHDKQQRREWIVKIRRDVGKNFKISSATRVCSEHFHEKDFLRTLSGLTRLRPGVIPSVFQWTKTTTERPAPKKRSNDVAPDPCVGCDEGVAADGPVHTTPAPSADHDYSSTPVPAESQLAAAQAEIARLQEKVRQLEQEKFFLDRFSSDPQAISFYTGFNNYQTLVSVFTSLEPSANNMIRWTQMQRHSCNMNNVRMSSFNDSSLPLIDQFFMFLCRVRQGLAENDLAVRFGVSQSSVSRLLITWANYLYFMLGSLAIWPSRSVVDKNMPECFRKTYPKTRVILDCTELKVQTPSSKVLNSETYSQYKSHTTFKGLIGITPCGVLSFVSTLYTGCISDKEITARSGIVDLIEPNDSVMADKGFLIQDLLDNKQAMLVIPPFLGKKGKFSATEVSQTHEIARLRIHVERAIRRVKEYHIFDGVVPLSLAPSINQIWTTCSILTNFRGPLF
ncbi:uncharacterized protein LOC144867211 [Branchiostoma floridae x Branchiostoma japonicum]